MKRSKRPSRPTEGLVIRHEGSSSGVRWIVLFLVPITMAALALAYRFYEERNAFELRLADVPSIEARRDQLANALTTERLRGDALEKDLFVSSRSLEDTARELKAAKDNLSNQPQPAFNALLKPGGLELADFQISPGEEPNQSTIKLAVSRLMSASGLSSSEGPRLGHLTVEGGEAMAGNVRVVVIPKDENNGKRVYLPQKSWRRSEGFRYALKAGEQSRFEGSLVIPDEFEPGSARVEIFVNEADGGYTLLRRVVPWPDS